MLVVALSLLAAFLFAASASMQQRAVRVATTERHVAATGRHVVPLPVVRLARRLARSPLWLAGCLANIAGTLVQAVALHAGSVATVQTVLVTQLIFALPLSTLWYRRWPRRADWLAGVAICGGLALFLTVPGAVPVERHPDRLRVAIVTIAAGLLVGLIVAAVARRRGLVHAALVAVAAGVCFAVTAMLIKVTLTDLLEHGLAATARGWPGYCLAVFDIAGFTAEQEAFAAGSLAAAMAGMTITNPVASYLLGAVAFQTTLPTTAAPLAALALAGGLITVGVIGLAHSPMVCREVASRPAAARQ